jgi:hypothetical protein
MDTMVLLVGDSRCDEDDGCACSHDLTRVPKQDYPDRWRLHVGGDALKIVLVNSQFQMMAGLNDEFVGGNI